MSTNYFILGKSEQGNQIVVLNNSETHILPQVNLNYYATYGLFEQSLIQWSVQFCDKNKLFLAFCHNFGLGSEEQSGEQTLNIVSNDGGGSTLHSTDAVLKREQIHLKTLDSLHLQNIGFIKIDVENIGFIKIDVEGNELDVLKGARNTLKNSNYPKIIFESNAHNPELFAYILDLGYRITGISGYTNMFLASA